MKNKDNSSKSIYSNRINSIARHLFEQLAEAFPVCMASDEFHFFPQFQLNNRVSTGWDDFSLDSISETVTRLEQCDRQLNEIEKQNPDFDERVDIRMLRRAINTICEQFVHIGVHRSQPTFALSIMGIGLAEAFAQGGDVFTARLKSLPGFIDRIRNNLAAMPGVFRDMGCKMIKDLQPWLRSFHADAGLISAVMQSMDRLNNHLENAPVVPDPILPQGQYERIVRHYMGGYLCINEVGSELKEEIAETKSILHDLCQRNFPGKSWEEAVEASFRPEPGPGGLKHVYEEAISGLLEHCRKIGLVSDEILRTCPVIVRKIPDYLKPVRTNAAYSISPDFPPKGGTFFIMESDRVDRVPPDYRLLTAHETFPGHHLLDTIRLTLARPARRHLEFPVFYEGWACFAEEILFDTGFFSTPADRLLLAKRRYFRALRGYADYGIQTRKFGVKKAAALFSSHGMDHKKAVAMVYRYMLKPGYQLSYAIGRRFFRRRYDRFIQKNNDPACFARRILSSGEIDFEHLKQIV